MPALITPDNKATIKRFVPQSSNKIITAGIARLYISLPNSGSWTYTGLAGAAVLAYDEVGKCFFFKLVDVVGGQGILWDQELYEGFHYHQDRTYFHSFEITDCLAAFSFSDEREASNFLSKVESRAKKVGGKGIGSRVKGLFGGGSSKVDKLEHRQDSVQATQMSVGVRPGTGPAPMDRDGAEWARLVEALARMGISKDQIEGNEEMIQSFMQQQQQEPVPDVAHAPATTAPRARAPPPPSLPASHNTSAIMSSAVVDTSDISANPGRVPSAPSGRRAVPPPLANAKPILLDADSSRPAASPTLNPAVVASSGDAASARIVPPPPPASRAARRAGPPPPPSRGKRETSEGPPSYAPSIPAKVPDEDAPRKFNDPPPFDGARAAPPAPPGRGPLVPPLSARLMSSAREVPAAPGRSVVPPPPPRTGQDQPPRPPARTNVPPAPPLQPTSSAGPPPPPPPPPSADTTSSMMSTLSAAPVSQTGRDNLLASIRSSGGKGLRKTTTVDKSAPVLPGSTTGAPAGSVPPAPNDMAGQLAAMLSSRNKKVAARSDDESDEDW
ncbi:hypothetical protein PYCC9005_005580 [Savitreella phatthalungensis]